MSHFTVLVALPAMARDEVDAALSAALAPYDENTEVTPYREYKTGNAEDHWTVTQCRENGQLPADGDLTWQQVADAYNARHSLDKDDSEHLHVDDEGDAYTVSTYNPKSKWDWWQIGGRWTGYFLPTIDAIGDPRLLLGSAGIFGSNKPGRVDGGPRGLLDLQALRHTKALEAGAQHDQWHALVSDCPPAKGWSTFVARHKADPDGYPVEQARTEYGAQAQVRVARQSRDFLGLNCPIDTFAVDRAVYAEQAAEQAVPGYAFLDLNGEWQAPGEMGWFGMSSNTADDRAAYRRRINEEIDALPADAYLVAVDCHI